METLKFKIFDVLVGRITVLAFENWLYNSEEFMSQINSNSFCFDIISINYKIDGWSEKLNALANKEYDKDFIEILSIEQTCLRVLNAKNKEEAYIAILPYLDNRDYNSDYHIVLQFYNIEYAYNSFQYTVFDKEGLIEEAKFYAQQVINNLMFCDSLKEKKKALILELKPYIVDKKKSKLNLKQKILNYIKRLRIIALIFAA